MAIPNSFRINNSRNPFSSEELSTLPEAQKLIETALMREKFVARSIKVLAKVSGLSEEDIAEYCEKSGHIARSPYKTADGKAYYGILSKLLTKYKLTPNGSFIENFDSFANQEIVIHDQTKKDLRKKLKDTIPDTDKEQGILKQLEALENTIETQPAQNANAYV